MTLLYILIGIFIVGVFILLFRQEAIQRFKDDIILIEGYLKCPPSQQNYNHLCNLFSQILGKGFIDEQRVDDDFFIFVSKYRDYIANDLQDFAHRYGVFIKKHLADFSRGKCQTQIPLRLRLGEMIEFNRVAVP